MNNYSHNFAVCVGRQLGSGGRNVALAISRKMGIAFYDKEIINQAAKDSGLDPEYFEKVDEKPTVPILGGFAGVHIPFFSGGYLDTESYLGNNNLFKIQSRTVEMLADKGPGVFVGRCADYILRDRPRVLSVFITATMEDRIERLSKLLSITPEEAEARIKECDRKRAEYYNYYSNQPYQYVLDRILVNHGEFRFGMKTIGPMNINTARIYNFTLEYLEPVDYEPYPDAIEEVGADAAELKAYAQNGYIIVETDEPYTSVSANGGVVPDTDAQLVPGVYIVRAGSKTVKVVVD